jgi:hypothetical protein
VPLGAVDRSDRGAAPVARLVHLRSPSLDEPCHRGRRGPGPAGRPGLRAGGRLGGVPTGPAHPLSGRLGMVANSRAIRTGQPRVPNRHTAPLIASATLAAVLASDRCRPEANSASRRASSTFSRVIAVPSLSGVAGQEGQTHGRDNEPRPAWPRDSGDVHAGLLVYLAPVRTPGVQRRSPAPTDLPLMVPGSAPGRDALRRPQGAGPVPGRPHDLSLHLEPRSGYPQTYCTSRAGTRPAGGTESLRQVQALRPVVCCAVVCREGMRHRRQHLRAKTRSGGFFPGWSSVLGGIDEFPEFREISSCATT